MTEFELFDAPGSYVAEITTDGATVKPFINAVNAVVDEARIDVSEDGLSAGVIEPANAFMGRIHLPASAFDSYDLSTETDVGVNIGALKSLSRRARKGADDELTLSIRERELTASVARGYENHNVVSQGTMDLIDPAAIRQEQELPDLDWDVDVTVDYTPFMDALSYAVGVADHVEISVKGVNQHMNALYFGGETDTRKESAAIDNIDTSETAESMYSVDYVEQIMAGLSSVDTDDVAIQLDDEYPATFNATDKDTGMSVQYLVAPRISE